MAELVVGVPHRGPSVVTLPFDLAAAGGLDAHGVQVRLVEGTYDQLSAWLASGRIHLCRRGPDVDVVAASAGAPIASCASVMQAAPAQVVVGEDVTAPGDLRGRLVGVIDPAMGSTLALQEWLRRNGVAADEVTFEVVGATRARLEAVAAGAVAATVVTAPSFFDLPAGTRALASLDEALGPFLFSAVQVHRPSAAARSEDITRYLAAVVAAVERLRTDDRVAPEVAGLLDVPPPVAEKVLDRARRLRWYPPQMEFGGAAVDAMLNALRVSGHVRDSPPPEAWIWDDARLAALHRPSGGFSP